MTTRKDIKEQLMNPKPDWDPDFEFTNEDGTKTKLSLDSFGSFLACKDELPSNKELQKILDTDPKKFTPKAIAKGLDFSFVDSFFDDEDTEFNNKYMFVGLNVAARSTDKKKNGKLIKADTMKDWKNFHDMERITNTVKLYVQLNQDRFKGCYITDIIKNTVESNGGKAANDFFLTSYKKISFLHDEAGDDEKRAQQYLAWDRKAKANFLSNHPDGTYSDRFADESDALQTVKANKETFKKSVTAFITECNTIKPKHLVVFGGQAYSALKLIKEAAAIKANDADTKNVNIGKLIDNVIWLDHYSGYGKKFTRWFEEQPSESNNKKYIKHLD